MSNVIACRISNYGRFQQQGWKHLPTIGIGHIEISVPQDAAYEAMLRRMLDEHRLAVSSFQGTLNVRDDHAATALKRQVQICQRFGARCLFVSCKADDEPRDKVWSRLRACGDVAAEHGVTIVMETHPDLATSGDVARQTMEAVSHPHVRVNFDTANVYYYNQGVTTMSELTKVIDYVAAVHLKDTDGSFKSGNFPVLGRGVVDFPAVFAALSARNFAGPFTMELEGHLMVNLDEAAQLKWVADSVNYLRTIGAL